MLVGVVAVVSSEKGIFGACGSVVMRGFDIPEDEGYGGRVGVPLRAGGSA